MAVASLPGPLAHAIAAEATRLPSGELIHAAQSLSMVYRREGGAIPLALNDAQRAAYLTVRMPATYAAISTAMAEMNRLQGDAGLRSCLDIGAGPGTASLAAFSLWPSLSTHHVERDRGWLDVAARLSSALGAKATASTGDLLSARFETSDLVLAAYALNEIPAGALDAAVKRLWSATAKALVIVEPGTPSGFAVVRRARELCLELGAHAAAPCTHDGRCPMTTDDWCHRSVRVERTALHRRVKGADLAWEDEKFSFVALTREPPRRIAPARIVRKPIRAGGHVHLDLCTSNGLGRATVARSDRVTYKAARDVEWGELWPKAQSAGDAD
jgi:ribosomal protein RSM22 (predicted rRNA methylase)